MKSCTLQPDDTCHPANISFAKINLEAFFTAINKSAIPSPFSCYICLPQTTATVQNTVGVVVLPASHTFHGACDWTSAQTQASFDIVWHDAGSLQNLLCCILISSIMTIMLPYWTLK